MPELPEVETVRRTLAPYVEGRYIVAVRVYSPLCADSHPDALIERLVGRTITRLSRTGKHLLFELESGVLDVHLRMTGKLLLNAMPGPHTRAVVELADGRMQFDDIRQFGRLRWVASMEEIERLGPDVLELNLNRFRARIRARRGTIKPLLLNQAVMSGLGNIYVDEALFLACIHPRTPAARLGSRRLARLHAAISEILSASIAAGGSSISDYVDARGGRGSYQERHRVYGREGTLCVRCGSVIRRTVVGQRGTHYCPRCQRL